MLHKDIQLQPRNIKISIIPAILTIYIILIAYYFLSNAFIITFILVEFASTGKALNFLAGHTSYSKWFYDGFNVPVLEKLSYYPQLILRNVSPVIWTLVIVALIFLRSDRDRGWKLPYIY